MRLKGLKRQDGMVLVTVIAVIFVMSMLLTAILSQNLSQASVTQAQIDEMKAKQLALGAFWKAQAELNNTATAIATDYSETLDGKVFTVTVDPRPATTGSNVAYNVNVTY